MMRKPDGSYCLLEFKTANSLKKSEWENGNVPPQYIYQVRQYIPCFEALCESVVMW